MKLQAPYFGNRFANILKTKTAKTSRKAKAKVTSEMETLEPRILLSGVGTGLNKKKVTFIDADGDKVLVTIQGKGSSFDIDLGGATNKADIANIDINGVGASLGIVVSPVGSFTKPIKTSWMYDPGRDGNTASGVKVQTQYYNLTPGYTSIGSITSSTSIGSIGLNAAVVADINIQGNANFLNLSTGLVAKVDQFMETNGSYLPGYAGAVGTIPGGWIAGLGELDFHNINIKGSVAGINISGSPALVNDYLGDITVGSLGRLTGINSAFNGQLTLTANSALLGSVVIGNGWGAGSGIYAVNDLTFNAAGFKGVLDVDGHLNLAINGGNFTGTIIADKGISGLRPGTADAINFTGAQVNGQIFSGGDISDIFLTNANIGGANAGTIRAVGTINDITIGNNSVLTNTTIEAANIGTISAYNATGLGEGNSILTKGNLEGLVIRNGNLTNSNVISVGGNIGLIDITNGNLNANLAAGSFGDIIVRGDGTGADGNINGKLVSTTGGFGSITTHFGSLNGTISSQTTVGPVSIVGGNLAGLISANGIGAVDIELGNLTGVLKSASTIGTVSVNNGSISGSIIADTAIASITAHSSAAVDGIQGAAVISAGTNIGAILGTSVFANGIGAAQITAGGEITSVTGRAYAQGGQDGISGLTLIGGSIGAINGTSEGNIGLNGVVAIATNAAGAGIGPITAAGLAGGINGGSFTSASSIAQVTGTGTAGAGGSGSGISGTNFIAAKAVVGISGTSYSQNGADAGLLNVNVTAGTTLGNVTGQGNAGAGIQGGNYVTLAGDITGNITGTTLDASQAGHGITGAKIDSAAAILGNILGDAAGTGNGLNAVNISAIGNIANITGNSTFGSGISGGSVNSVTGNIGTIAGASSSAVAPVTSHGITGGFTANAWLGTITAVSGTSNNINGGHGLDGVTINAGNAPAGGLVITGDSSSGNGINNGVYTLLAGNLVVNGNTDTGAAINGGAFTANTGTITINATVTDGGQGIIGGSVFTGQAIGNITVNLVTANSGDAINGAQFTATAGSIGDITVNNASTIAGKFGIINSKFNATNGIATTNGIQVNTFGSGISSTGPGLTVFNADTDGDGTGAIGNITVIATGAGAVAIGGVGVLGNVQFNGTSLGNIIVKSTSAAGGNAIADTTFVATQGNIGDITAIASGIAGFAAKNSSFAANLGSIGGATNTLTFTGGAGGLVAAAAINAVLTAKNNIGNIVANVTDVAGAQAISGVITAQTGSIGTITVASAATTANNTVEGTINAGSGIGHILIGSNSAVGLVGSAALAANINADTNGGNTVGIAAPTTGFLNSITINQAGTGHGITSPNIKAALIGANLAAGQDAIAVNMTNTTAGTGILNATITAKTNTETAVGSSQYNNFGSIGTINVQVPNHDGSAAGGSGIVGSNFNAGGAGVGIGAITVNIPASSGVNNSAGITNSNFNAAFNPASATLFNSIIGNVTVTNTSGGVAIGGALLPADVTFTANNGVGNFNVVSQGIGMQNVNITADNDANGTGNLGDVRVNITGVGAGATGIIGGTWTGFNVGAGPLGNIDVIFTNATAVPAGNGIQGLTITAANNIGNINVGQGAGNNAAGLIGILNPNFTATAGNIGAITVTSVGTALSDLGLGGLAKIEATAGSIGAISLTSQQGSALDFSNNPASQIKAGTTLASFTAASQKVTGTQDAVFATGIGHTALLVGTNVIGNILVTNASTNGGADAMLNIKFDIGNPGPGSVLGTTTVIAAGGAALNLASIDPVNMGAVVLTGPLNAMIGSNLVATGALASLTVNGTIDNTSFITVGSVTGATAINAGSGGTGGNLAGIITVTNGNLSTPVTVAGNLSGTLQANNGNIGNVVVTGNVTATGIIQTNNTGANTGGSIGNVTVNGDFTGLIHAKHDTAANGTIGEVLLATTSGGNVNADGALNKLAVTTGNLAANIQVASVTNAAGITAPGNIIGTITTTVGGGTVTSTTGSIQGSVTVAGTSTLNAATALQSIGNVTGSGLTSMGLTLNSPTVGNVTFNTLPAGQTLTLALTAVTNIGNISVATGNLSSAGSATLTNIGSAGASLTVGGNLVGGGTFGPAAVGTGLTLGGVANNGIATVNTSGLLTPNAFTFNINQASYSAPGNVLQNGASIVAPPSPLGTYGPTNGLTVVLV